MLSMFSIKSAKDAAHYYEKDDYYTKDDPEHKKYSEWYGKAAEDLNLSGQVEKEQFVKMLEGRLPNGEQLGLREGNEIKHACGVDLTFSAPKSVSILSEILGDKQVTEAHKKAVQDTLKYVEEKKLVKIRKKIDGTIVKEDANNIAVAIFRHNTSRAGDPQKHDHCIFLNVVKREDGNWRSADFKGLFENKMLLGQIYRSNLACELKELGYSIKRTGKGMFEVAGVPDNMLDNFSQRSKTIKEALKDYDFKNAKTKAIITKMTRENKKNITKPEFQTLWSEKCKDHNFNNTTDDVKNIGLQEQEAIVERSTKHTVLDYLSQRWQEFCSIFESSSKIEVKPIDNTQSNLSKEEQAVLYAIEHLTERSSVFTEKDLIKNALESGLGDLKISKIEKGINKLLENKTLLKSKLVEFENMLTTKDALNLEKDTIALLKGGFKTQKSLYTKKEAKKHLKNTSLNKGQKAAVSLILNTKDRVVGIQGHAGTGKTYMLQTAKRLLDKKEYEAIGLASSSSAASILQKETKIKSKTVHKFLQNLRYVG